MSQRYIELYRLPQRPYTDECPAVIAAGALLKDTAIARTVGQLKIKSASPAKIEAVTVKVTVFKGNNESVSTEFTYSGLNVRRGESFGQYKAIVLPENCGESFEASIISVQTDIGLWTRGEERAETEAEAEAEAEVAKSANEKSAALRAEMTERAAKAEESVKKAMAGASEKAKKLRELPKPSKKTAIIAAAAIAAVLAGIFVLPSVFKGGSSLPRTVSSDDIPPMLEERATVYISADQSGDLKGKYIINAEKLREFIPDAAAFSMLYSVPLGSDINEYVKMGYSFAFSLLHPEVIENQEWDMLEFEPSGNMVTSITVLDRHHNLIAYYCGVPEEDDGLCELEFSLCYEPLEDMMEEERQSYYSTAYGFFSNYIPFEEAESRDDIAYYIRGYNTGRTPEFDIEDCQYYFLMRAGLSSRVVSLCRRMEDIGRVRPADDRYVACLLFDREYHIVGYTTIAGKDAAHANRQPQTDGDSISAIDYSSVPLRAEEGGRYTLDMDCVRASGSMPNAVSFEAINSSFPEGALRTEDIRTSEHYINEVLEGQFYPIDYYSYTYTEEQLPYLRQRYLFFDADGNLVGYNTAAPVLTDGGARLDVTLCDFDFSRAAESDRAAFLEVRHSLADIYISPEAAVNVGATYFIPIDTYFNSPEDAQSSIKVLFYIYAYMNCRDVGAYCNTYDFFGNFEGNVAEGTVCPYLMLDGYYNILGFSAVDHS